MTKEAVLFSLCVCVCVHVFFFGTCTFGVCLCVSTWFVF